MTACIFSLSAIGKIVVVKKKSVNQVHNRFLQGKVKEIKYPEVSSVNIYILSIFLWNIIHYKRIINR